MVVVQNLYKCFPTSQGAVKAVDHLNFEVAKGSFFTLLGPSGCGKTTTLRCIAGLERPEEGEIEVEGVAVFSSSRNIFTPSHQRDIGMVFQSYAIWPHMNVFDNVAFPLKIGRRVSKKEMVERAERALSLVHLDGLKERPATNLSGGQQQRLALARAIVREPKLLLLDEPLSNLDAKLRDEMRGELKRVQGTLGLTTLYVTHDQTEALSMSDSVAVMNEGKIIQVGEPRRLYERPVNRFVADFIGAANLIPGILVSLELPGNLCLAETPSGPLQCVKPDNGKTGAKVFVSIRPEDISLTSHPSSGSPEWAGEVKQISFLGELVDYRISVGELMLRARVHPTLFLRQGDRVFLTFQPERCCALAVDRV
ncbi:MAG: ABC transporter ATP-binding protein [Deltaproteobacteria bacterium]|nr:ABC transporter ATP-binding protein [Deltaproteobacteria bacterium]